MDELMNEYGGILLGITGGIAVMGIVIKLFFSGGLLGELLIRLGMMAC